MVFFALWQLPLAQTVAVLVEMKNPSRQLYAARGFLFVRQIEAYFSISTVPPIAFASANSSFENCGNVVNESITSFLLDWNIRTLC